MVREESERKGEEGGVERVIRKERLRERVLD